MSRSKSTSLSSAPPAPPAPPSGMPTVATSLAPSEDRAPPLPGPWVVGGIVRHSRDHDLCLIRGGLASDIRIKIQRWADGAIRSADRKDLTALSPGAIIACFKDAIRHENRRFALRSGSIKQRGSSLIDELNLFVSSSEHYQQLLSYRQDFIREFVIMASWWQTHQDPYISWHFIYTNIRLYCGMIGVAPPGWTLARRRLCQLEKLNNSRKARR